MFRYYLILFENVVIKEYIKTLLVRQINVYNTNSNIIIL